MENGGCGGCSGRRPARTPPVAPTPDHVDDLLARFRRSPTSNEGRRAGRRALKCCTTDRVDDVLELLGADDPAIQEIAARLLGDWAWAAAVPALVETVRNGRHNGRLAALRALRRIPGPEAAAAITTLRAELGEGWEPYFR